MKKIKALVIIMAGGLIINVNAQESKSVDDLKKQSEPDTATYYEQRAYEDAKYEQEFNAKNEREDKSFWKEQKKYEKQLKKNNKIAYRAYIQGKKDAYAEHHQHCNHNHHSDYFYTNTQFYYYEYENRRNYDNRPYRPVISTPVRVSTPRIRLGIF